MPSKMRPTKNYRKERHGLLRCKNHTLQYDTFRAISACDTTAAVELLLLQFPAPPPDEAAAALLPLLPLPLPVLVLPPGLTGLIEAVVPSPLLLLLLFEASLLPLWPALLAALWLWLACAAINWCW